MGFSLLASFDDKDISTDYSALMSKVVADGRGRIKFPINEPAKSRRRSQIDEFLDFYGGPGVQHIAMATGRHHQQRARHGCQRRLVPQGSAGVLRDAAGSRRHDPKEDLHELAELGILVDRDDEGYLLQIFTKPVEDRPTLFFEIIQRRGATQLRQGELQGTFRGHRTRTGAARDAVRDPFPLTTEIASMTAANATTRRIRLAPGTEPDVRAREQASEEAPSPPEKPTPLLVTRRDIEFMNIDRGHVQIAIRVTNTGPDRSEPTPVLIESAPFGAFVDWQLLAMARVRPLEPGESTILHTAAAQTFVQPLGLPHQVSPHQILVAVCAGGYDDFWNNANATTRGSFRDATRSDLLRAASRDQGQQSDFLQTSAAAMVILARLSSRRGRKMSTAPTAPSLPPSPFDLLTRPDTHWAGNLNVFIGGVDVERHCAGNCASSPAAATWRCSSSVTAPSRIGIGSTWSGSAQTGGLPSTIRSVPDRWHSDHGMIPRSSLAHGGTWLPARSCFWRSSLPRNVRKGASRSTSPRDRRRRQPSSSSRSTRRTRPRLLRRRMR